ncbi:MAG TPA: DUF2203 domain-containing protein [Candidatus Dormibacteraeota bacterium]|nr:DUF2203 domain-containing protein [Candidatus Dormibacteraeota bacterium]
MAERLFTADEANALLPSVREVIERIRDNQRVLADDKSLATVREKASHNGGGLPSRHLSNATHGLERDLKQLQEWGIVLRDPTIGLIDFYGERKGETIFLCWKLGEPRVEWWHPLNTGIAGRQKL